MNKSSAKTLLVGIFCAFVISFSSLTAQAAETNLDLSSTNDTIVRDIGVQEQYVASLNDQDFQSELIATSNENIVATDPEATALILSSEVVLTSTSTDSDNTEGILTLNGNEAEVVPAAFEELSVDFAPHKGTPKSCPVQTLGGVLRDFKDTHTNFEVLSKNPASYGMAPESDMVMKNLGVDNKPVFNTSTITTTNSVEFNEWYNDVPGVNQSTSYAIHLNDGDADGVYSTIVAPFFVIDDQLFGNQGRAHNYHFTYEVHSNFKYKTNTFFTITADDDVMLYINGTLVSLPLLGIHPPETYTYTITPALATALGMVAGNNYSFDLFYAERNTSEAELAITTNAVFNDCVPSVTPSVTLSVDGAPTTTIAPGETAQLTWTSTNAVSCVAVPAGAFATAGAVSNTVGVSVTPASTTVYTIECVNSAGDKAMSTATVNVVAGPMAPTASLLVNGLDSVTISAGSTVRLTWTSTNATSCTANPVGSFATGGLVASVAPGVAVTPAVTTTYKIDCTDGTTTASDTATVTVVPAGVLPTVTIYPVPAQISLGQSSTLIWSSANATSCTSTDFTTNSYVTGTVLVTPVVTTNYTVSCVNGASAPVTATTTVTIVPTATTPTVTLTATPTIIQQGGSSLLTWISANAAACTPGGFVGPAVTVNTVGVMVSPAVTTTYSITCADSMGYMSPISSVTIVVIPPTDPSVTLTVTPPVVSSGQSAIITWSSINATMCTAPWMTTPGISGAQSVSPVATTTYSISCSNAAGASVATSVFVNVLTATITATPTSITAGASSTLTWSSGNALSCSSLDFVVPAGATSGTVVVTPGVTKTYTITCVNGTATASTTATVTVNPVSSGGGGGGSGGFLLPQTVQNIPTIVKTTTVTKKACPMIRGYWDLGEKGVNVKKIQEFLNAYEGENLTVNGIYGTTTWKAVKRFQTKYKHVVLAPWGKTEATGFWYKSTSTLANYLLGCDIIHVNLEDKGRLDDVYTANKAPKRYLEKRGQITYAQFCRLTNDCGLQSSKRARSNSVRGRGTVSTQATVGTRRASAITLPQKGYIDCVKAVAPCFKQGYELPQGLTTSITDDSPWFGKFFGFGAK